MSSKRKNTISSSPRRNYTTRQIMAITEERRKKEEALRIEAESKAKVQLPEALIPAVNPKINEEVNNFVQQVNLRPAQEGVEAVKEDQEVQKAQGFQEVQKVQDDQQVQENESSKIELPIVNSKRTRPLVYVLLIAVLLLVAYLRFPETWVKIISAQLNALIIFGSSLLLNVLQGSVQSKASVLNLQYYKINLQGDLVGFYSLELLFVFGLLFAFIQKTSLIKRVVVFFSLFPLAVIVNIFRVLMASGIALNDGAASADHYFYGILVRFVFVFAVLGMFFLEFLTCAD